MKLCLSFIILFSISTYAEDGHHHHHKKRHHKAHSHGEGKLNLATEDNELSIEIVVPGHDIVGFEHKPKTDAQKKKVSDAVKALKNMSANIELPKEAGCTPNEEAEVEVELDGDHSEFEIEYEYNCKKISELSFVNVLTFDKFKGMKKLKAQGVTGSGQHSKTLTPTASKFDLGK